jgi:hypothetical protein
MQAKDQVQDQVYCTLSGRSPDFPNGRARVKKSSHLADISLKAAVESAQKRFSFGTPGTRGSDGFG